MRQLSTEGDSSNGQPHLQYGPRAGRSATDDVLLQEEIDVLLQEEIEETAEEVINVFCPAIQSIDPVWHPPPAWPGKQGRPYVVQHRWDFSCLRRTDRPTKYTSARFGEEDENPLAIIIPKDARGREEELPHVGSPSPEYLYQFGGLFARLTMAERRELFTIVITTDEDAMAKKMEADALEWQRIIMSVADTLAAPTLTEAIVTPPIPVAAGSAGIDFSMHHSVDAAESQRLAIEATVLRALMSNQFVKYTPSHTQKPQLYAWPVCSYLYVLGDMLPLTDVDTTNYSELTYEQLYEAPAPSSSGDAPKTAAKTSPQ